MVCKLDDELWFPDPRYGDPDGCIAVGGDLSVDRLLLAYSNGIFPWYSFRDDTPMWYCPLKRFVIFPDEIHVSHSMRTLMNKGRYRVSINEDFWDVINNCGQLRINEKGAWLGPNIMEAYTELFLQGFAASVEVWERNENENQNHNENENGNGNGDGDGNEDGNGDGDGEATGERLVGGLYGVNIGRAFFGESMFSLVPSASKLALIHLARTMQEKGGTLIDCQFETAHLKSMGGRYISYNKYMKLIR